MGSWELYLGGMVASFQRKIKHLITDVTRRDETGLAERMKFIGNRKVSDISKFSMGKIGKAQKWQKLKNNKEKARQWKIKTVCSIHGRCKWQSHK